MIAKQDVFIDQDGKACVAGPDARRVLVRQGQEIAEKQFEGIEGAEALIDSEPTKAAKKKDAAKDLEERKEKKGR